MTDLTPWEVPFAAARYPSVGIITEHGGDNVTLVVAPSGIDKYPKYLVRFERVVVLLSYEEAHAFDRGYGRLTGFDVAVCAYRWIDSPWLVEYRKGEPVFGWHGLQHFLTFGGDSIVEVLAPGEPVIERIDGKAILETRHEV